MELPLQCFSKLVSTHPWNTPLNLYQTAKEDFFHYWNNLGMSWGSAKLRVCWNNLRVFLFLTLSPSAQLSGNCNIPTVQRAVKNGRSSEGTGKNRLNAETAVGFRRDSACPSGEKRWREFDGLLCYVLCAFFCLIFFYCCRLYDHVD